MINYKCIKEISQGPKKHKSSFKVGDIVYIVNNGEKYILLSDVNMMRGLSILREEFNSYFKII